MQAYRIRLWDLPTRIVHWCLFLLVAAAFYTGLSGGNLIEWHARIGLAIAGLLAFRVVWGFVGSTYARFSQFVQGPGAILEYLSGRWHGLGHNPLGALSVLVLLGILTLQVLTGLFSNDDIAFNGPLFRLIDKDASNTLTNLHRELMWVIGALVLLHVCAMVFYAIVRKDNLVIPMITGKKQVETGYAMSAEGGGIFAFILALAIACGVVWIANGSWVSQPAPPPEQTNLPSW